MPRLPDHLILPTTPVAAAEATITGDDWRITVLTDRLLRLEHSPAGVFEDRATQTVINRVFPVPSFSVERDGRKVRIDTGPVRLSYDGERFSGGGLSADLVGGSGHGRTWRFGEPDRIWGDRPGNLGGTARTLDEADGRVPLGEGVLSRNGYAVLDDSTTMALATDGWVAPRHGGNLDLYLFAHGDDFTAALADFHALTGPPPLLPRWALGNWWSRYHAYSAEEYQALHERFAAEGLPFSVAVIDMDWHLVDVPPEFGTGWTGYTWNRQLFPDPAALLAWLHERGLKVSLNVHPADGVRAYEDAYPAIAQRLGIDPASGQPARFDIANPDFLRAYFETVHHPLEDEGVDFWWLDWQQGTHTAVAGLDPLWMLNHYHYLDSARNGDRPITFSRYAGPGSHRYPVGFSGDTITTWASLAFQPEFTAAAANIGYGWWSHDIGGHMFGRRDDEMVARWFQLGVFSPINRLHSTKNPFMGKEPWRYDGAARAVMSESLRLRHRLIPYLYTMNERAHRTGLALCRPLHHEPAMAAGAPQPWGWEDPRFTNPNTFYFGADLVVAPITEPADPELRLGAVSTWLPPGTWIDWFTGLRYRGDRRIRLHRPLSGYPVLARAGAIVPLSADDDLGVGNPAALEVLVFAGADGDFVLYEDDDAAHPRAVRTPISWRQTDGVLRVGPAEGDRSVIAERRRWRVVLIGADDVSVVGFESTWDAARHALTVAVGEVASDAGFELKVGGHRRPADQDVTRRVFDLLEPMQLDYLVKDRIWGVMQGEASTTERLVGVVGLELPKELEFAVLEILLADPR